MCYDMGNVTNCTLCTPPRAHSGAGTGAGVRVDVIKTCERRDCVARGVKIEDWETEEALALLRSVSSLTMEQIAT